MQQLKYISGMCIHCLKRPVFDDPYNPKHTYACETCYRKYLGPVKRLQEMVVDD